MWPGHAQCFKYQQINIAGTRERLIAFLYAWNLWGEGKSREDHAGQKHNPPDILVDATCLRLFSEQQPAAAANDEQD